MNPAPRPQPLSQEVWQRPFVKAQQKWCDDFVVELRLLDVPGAVIGDRLAEVETHCAATGDTPPEAFGDPADYAVRIAQDSTTEPASGVWKVAALSAGQVMAMLVGTTAVAHWARGEELSYNVAQVGLLVLFVLVLQCLPVLIRPLVHHPWAVGVPLAVGFPLLAVGGAFSARIDLPVALVLPSAPVAVGLFVVVLLLAWWEHRELTRGLDTDLVTSPLSPDPHAPVAGRDRRRRAVLLPVGLVPLAYLVLATFSWVFA